MDAISMLAVTSIDVIPPGGCRMPSSRARRCLVAILLTGLLIPSGCLTPSSRPVAFGELPMLAPGEGLVAFHLSTNVSLSMVGTEHFVAARDVEPGRHLKVLVVKAREYNWRHLKLPEGRRDVRIKIGQDDSFSFTVREGQLSYAGDLQIRNAGRDIIGGRIRRGVTVRNVNRAIQALTSLEEQHPQLLERYPLEYGGLQRDDFLARLRTARSSAGGE